MARRYYLRSAAWGGPPSILYGRTPPETREFYDLCDEAGITVWQVFPFGNAVLPKDPEFITGALHEALGYGERKRWFEMVRRACQPLLASLEYGKRRWMPGESLAAGLWVVNDTYESHPDVRLRLRVLDRNGNEKRNR